MKKPFVTNTILKDKYCFVKNIRFSNYVKQMLNNISKVNRLCFVVICVRTVIKRGYGGGQL